jgi:hypothetical protein
MLPGGKYPSPAEQDLEAYLKWDDWRVLGLLADGAGGKDGQRLLTRNHYRLVYQTRDNPINLVDLGRDETELVAVKGALGNLVAATKVYSNNWYKHDSGDIPVQNESDHSDIRPLSDYSSLLRKFTANDQELIYVEPENAIEAKRIVSEVVKLDHNPQLKIDFTSGKKKKEVASAS